MNKPLQIVNSTLNDLDLIFDFYQMAIDHQKKVFNKHWQGFDREMVSKEIAGNKQFKILVDGEVACIFAISLNDSMIWKERDADPSVYIHRIVTHPDFRGYKFVEHIIEWARQYCHQKGLDFIRMDTWADNEKLLAYYTGCGFTFTGTSKMEKEKDLPKHYEGITLNLFEIAVNSK
jgi:ribosomal protein S18 acetylase RimI-like enzyme